MASKLTKAEKETILLTSEADDVWSVYTFNAALKRKLALYASKHPELCCLKSEDTDDGSATYIISRSRMSIRLLEPCSENRRKTAAITARQNGLIP